jgi:hypothetical protein
VASAYYDHLTLKRRPQSADYAGILAKFCLESLPSRVAIGFQIVFAFATRGVLAKRLADRERSDLLTIIVPVNLFIEPGAKNGELKLRGSDQSSSNRRRGGLESFSGRNAGDPELAAALWTPLERAQHRRQREVLLLALNDELESLAEDMKEFCKAIWQSATPGDANVRRPSRALSNRAQILLGHITNAFNACATQQEREQLAGRLLQYFTDHPGGFPGLQFDLRVVAGGVGANSPPATIQGRFIWQGQEVAIRFAIDDRWDPTESAQRLAGLIEQNGGVNRAGRLDQVRRDIRTAWMELPGNQRIPPGPGQQPAFIATLNDLLHDHQPPLHVVFVPQQNGQRDHLVLHLTDQNGAIQGPNMHVGSLTWHQLAAIDARNTVGNQGNNDDNNVDPNNEPGWFSRFLDNAHNWLWTDAAVPAWNFIWRYPCFTLPGLGIAGFLGWRFRRQLGTGLYNGLWRVGQGEYRLYRGLRRGLGLGGDLRTRGMSRLDRQLFEGQRDLSNLRAGQEATTPASIMQFIEEATHVSSRQPRRIQGETAEARRLALQGDFRAALNRNRNSPFFNNDAITDYRAACLDLINELNGGSGGEASAANRANLLQEWLRNTGARLFPNHEDLFRRIQIVENSSLGTANVVATHRIVRGTGGQVSAIYIELPTASLTCSPTDPRFHETLASCYDQLYRTAAVAPLAETQLTDPIIRQIRTNGNVLADFIQFSINADNALVVGANANEGRLQLHDSRPLAHCPEGHMEMTEHGFVMRNADLRELTEAELRQYEMERVAEEVRRLGERRTALQTQIDNTPDGPERERLRAQHTALSAELTAARTRQGRLTSSDVTVRTQARQSLHEAFREAYRRGRARLGGRAVPIAMFVEEAVRYFLTH